MTALGMNAIRNSFIVRHWKGELPLWASWWLIVFVGGLLELLALNVIRNLLATPDTNDPSSILAAIVLSWSLVAVVGVWQAVGLWRAAASTRNVLDGPVRRPTWSHAARIAVIALVGLLVWSFVSTGLPTILRMGRIVAEGDPLVSDYALRVSPSGAVLGVRGGMKFGLSRDVQRILDACPRVKVVMLDSTSGRFAEAITLSRLIRDRHVETYVEGACHAGCTLAFMAGTRRWVRTGARLGFPKMSDKPDEVGTLRLTENEFRQAFERVAASPDFVTMALYGSPADLWFPDERELKRNGIVTDIVDAPSALEQGANAGKEPAPGGNVLCATE